MTPRRTQPRRVLLLACAAWCVAMGLAAPDAQRRSQPSAPRPRHDASLFSHSDNCVACHNGLSTASGDDVSIGTAWRATMMANSARDPYWQASVRRETLDHPSRSGAIEDECASCHMPMATRVARAAGGRGDVFRHLPLRSAAQGAQAGLAADGVSCTVCHQIAPDGLVTPASFNANFVLRPTPADGVRSIFGPYAIDAGRQTIMKSVTGFVQAEAPHIRESELCATCHTLVTEAYGPSGEVIGTLPEQMNYQEWQHSAFRDERRSCQSCHMPRAPGPIRAASVLGEPRESLARHLFVGGNAFMLRMLSRYRDDLGVDATAAELDATALATTRQLQEETATLALSPLERTAGHLAFDLTVVNLTGHKFPTGYPARRTWLHVTVADARGVVLFESGAVEPTGAIRGDDGDADPARFEPHYEEITSADQVQIYEPVLGDRLGAPTTGLLTAVRYIKDNRLLPRGFDKSTASADIAVHGGAAADDDFGSGGDRVRFRIAAPPQGALRVTVELLYQPIGYRWARALQRYDAPEPARFAGYYERAAATSATVVASTSAVTVER